MDSPASPKTTYVRPGPDQERSYYSFIVASLFVHVGIVALLGSLPYEARHYAVQDQSSLGVTFVQIVEPEITVEPTQPRPAQPELKPPEPESEKQETPSLEPTGVLEPEPEAVSLDPFDPSPSPPEIENRPLVTSVQVQGAVMEAKPDYLRNPAPKYPRLARRQGWEGTIVLRVEVLANGTAGDIEIMQTSSHRILDEVSVKAVRGWKFLAARIDEHPVRSWVEVPISFRLADN